MNQQINHNRQIEEDHHHLEDDILYKRLPANLVSWRRLLDQRFTLTSDDIRIRNILLEAIQFALHSRRQQVLKFLIIRNILFECLLEDRDDEAAALGHENFIVLFITVRQLFTLPIRSLVSQYMDTFAGVTRATHVQLYQNPPCQNRRIDDWTEDIILKGTHSVHKS